MFKRNIRYFQCCQIWNIQKTIRTDKCDSLSFENMWEINFGYCFYEYLNYFKYGTILEKKLHLYNHKIKTLKFKSLFIIKRRKKKLKFQLVFLFRYILLVSWILLVPISYSSYFVYTSLSRQIIINCAL